RQQPLRKYRGTRTHTARSIYAGLRGVKSLITQRLGDREYTLLPRMFRTPRAGNHTRLLFIRARDFLLFDFLDSWFLACFPFIYLHLQYHSRPSLSSEKREAVTCLR